MSIKEQVQDLFKPREVKKAERTARFEDAVRKERQATADYLTGEISLEKYNQLLDTTRPITKLDLRKLASELGMPE